MSNLIKLLHDTAALRAEYQRLHQDLLGLSVRRLLFWSGLARDSKWMPGSSNYSSAWENCGKRWDA